MKIWGFLLIAGMILLGGCGATWQTDLDIIGFPENAPPLTVKIGPETHELGVGDRMELQNLLEQDPNAALKLGGPTCIYLTNYLGIEGMVWVHAGYDPTAKKSDGSDKYSDALHDYAAAVSQYQLRITKDGNTQNIDVPYGENGPGILIQDLGAYQFRNSQNIYSAGALFEQLTLPSGADHTICFAYQKFAKFEAGELPSGADPIDTPPVPPAGFTENPIELPQDPNAPGGSGNDVPDSPSGQAESGGGCSLTRFESDSGSTFWMAFAALVTASGLIARRRIQAP